MTCILKKELCLTSRYRHEYKYLIDSMEESILLIKAQGLLERDSHIRSDGTYVISSLYFDDYDNTCYYDNEDGNDLKCKFRIRYYNDDYRYMRLERKSKRRGMSLKESCSITREQCNMFMEGKIPDITSDLSEQAKRFFAEMNVKEMLPKVIVTYERMPFLYPAGNVRVTFDRKISASDDFENFLSPTRIERPILPLGKSIMEVKWDEFLPSHINEYLQLDELQWTSFSKYYLCRKYNTNGGIK